MRYLISLLALLFFAAPAWTAPPLNIPFIQSFTNPGHIFNPMTEYRGSLRYFVDPNSSLMTVTVDGTQYGVDWNSVMEEAVAEWRGALQNSNFSLTRVTDRSQANLVIATTPDPPSVSTVTTLAATTPIHGGQPSTITFFSNQFQQYLSGTEATAAAKFMKDQTTQSLLQFMVRRIAKHELGHALGLAHSEVRSLFSVKVQPSANMVVAPIMVGNLFFFIRTAFAAANDLTDIPGTDFVPNPNQTLLTTDNIQIDAAAGDAVLTLITTQQATCSSILQCIKPPYINDGDEDDTYG